MGIDISILKLVLMQAVLLVFTILLKRCVDKKRQKYCSHKTTREEGKFYRHRYVDKTLALTFFPLSISLLLLEPGLFGAEFGRAYPWIIFFTFVFWVNVALVIKHVPQPGNKGWQAIYSVFNATSFAWLFGVATLVISKGLE